MEKLKVAYKPLASLRGYARNARTHSESQVLELAKSITQFGFVNPILIDDAGEIIAGHGRYLAAEHLGLDTVPVVQLWHLSEAQKRALRLADNRISQNSSWNYELLEAELRDLSKLDVDLSSLGFSDGEISQWLRDVEVSLPETEPRSDSGSTPEAAAVAPASPTPGVGQEPAAVWSEPYTASPASAPKASDDHYSKFEMVMEHTNKVMLIEVLDEIRSEFGYDKSEDALMHLCRHYRGEEE